MGERWIVERLDGPGGGRVDGGIFEGDVKDAAIRGAMAEDDRDGRVYYRITGPLPQGYGVLPPGEEFTRGGADDASEPLIAFDTDHPELPVYSWDPAERRTSIEFSDGARFEKRHAEGQPATFDAGLTLVAKYVDEGNIVSARLATREVIESFRMDDALAHFDRLVAEAGE